MTTSGIVVLTDINGISRLSGVDSNGSSWIQFEVDYFAEQENGECFICGEELSYGWMNLGGNEEVCDEHIHELD